MAKPQHIRSKKESKKYGRVSKLLRLWDKYHQSYNDLYEEYTFLAKLGHEGDHFVYLDPRDYKPDWSRFLTISDRAKAEEYLLKKRTNEISRMSFGCHAISIEFLIANMKEALRSWRHWNGIKDRKKSIFGPNPSSCGTGRHFSNDPNADTYLRFFR